MSNLIAKFRRYIDKDIDLSGMQYATYLLLIFIVGSMIGWVYEELDFFFVLHEKVKRGFLYGPWLPVYGTGGVLMLTLLGRWRRNPFVVFFGSMIIAAILEYSTAAAMMAIWHKRWWDYSGMPFNLQGYISLQSILSFGIMALALFFMIDPFVRRFVARRFANDGRVFSVVIWGLGAVMLVDVVLTFLFRNPVS